MRKFYLAFIFSFSIGCPVQDGNLGGKCNPDGTCNTTGLTCVEGIDGNFKTVYFCAPKSTKRITNEQNSN